MNNGMKKLAASVLVALLVGCNNNVNTNSISPVTTVKKTLTPQESGFSAKDIADFEQEYKSFSTKALTNAYVLRMFNKFLTTGAENPTQVIRQLEFARYLKDFKSDSTYFNSLSTIVGNDTSVYTKITGMTQVSQKMSSESSTFGTFVQSLSPFPGVPVATSATNVTASGFTANWSSISNATGYILTVTQGANSTNYPLGIVTTYNLTGLSANTAYSYTVKATNVNGASSPSNSTSVSTLIGLPSVPTANSATNITKTSFTANWSTVSDATGYKLFVDGVQYPNSSTVIAANLYNVTGVSVGSPHNYYLIAVNSNGDSTASNTISFSTIANGGVVTTYSAAEPGVTTFAGSTQGNVNSTGTSSQFSSPYSTAVDSSGNVYVADYGNHQIKKVTPAGVTTTLAGSGSAGYVNATGTSAWFNCPFGIAVDLSGNVYVADYANSVIRKVTPAGVVSTLAGDGASGFNDATGTNAKFANPRGVAVDASGNVFVADYMNNRIRKITPGGVVSTLAGKDQGNVDATGTNARFYHPFGVAVDASGNVFVAEFGNNKIRKVTPAGVVTSVAGSGTIGSLDGDATSAQFNKPYAVALDSSGNILVADYNNHRIRKIDGHNYSKVTTVAGSIDSFNNASGTNAQFSWPSGLSTDSQGNVYVADTGNHKIRKITDAQGFSFPYSTAIDSSNNLYVADYGNDKIKKITPAGVVSTIAGSGNGYIDLTGTNARFGDPMGVAVDSTGNLFIADYSNHVIRKITPGGSVTTFAGNGVPTFADGTGTNAKFANPRGIAVDSSDNVYVADYMNNKIRKITPAGVVTTLAGSTQGNVDATGTNAQFYYPFAVAVDSSGNVFVAEFGNNKIRKVTPAGVVTTLAGSGTIGSNDGPATSAQFNKPYGVAVDSAGNVFVADYTNHKIRKVTPAGIVSTLAGSTQGNVDATGTNARFSVPSGVTVDSSGNLYVADTGNDRIRKIE